MESKGHPSPLQETRIFHLLLVSALLQTLMTLCGFWALGLLLVAGRSETLQDLITLGSTLAAAMVKVGLHLLGI